MDVILHGFKKQELEAIERHAQSRGRKLETLLPGAIESRCEIHHRPNLSPDRSCRVQITMQVRGRTLRAEVKSKSVLGTIDGAAHKMERQIERFKGRRRRDRRPEPEAVAAPEPVAEESSPAIEAVWETAGLIAREKEFEVVPMEVEEAVEVMELLNHDFHVFLNPETQAVNVVYRRDSGNYGLLKPKTASRPS